MQVAAGSHPRDSCISGVGDAGLIPAAGCFQRAEMGSPGPLFPFPSWWSHDQGLRLRSGVQGQHPTPTSSPWQVKGSVRCSITRCLLTAVL